MVETGGGESDGPTGPPPAWSPPTWPPPGTTHPRHPERRPSTARRIVRAVAWIGGLVGVAFFGRVFAVLGGSTPRTAEQWGQFIGAIVGAVVLGLFARWSVVRILRRGRVRSPWILVVAILVLLLNLGRQPALGGPAAGASPIDSYARINAPYALTTATADEAAEFATAMSRTPDAAYEVRRVLRDGRLAGFLVVADLGADPSAEFRQGLGQVWMDDGGDEPTEAIVDGRTVLLGTRPSNGVVIWVEPPFGLTVFASDLESAQAIAAAVIAAY